MINKQIYFSIIFLYSIIAKSQEISAKIDKEVIKIGEAITLKIEIKQSNSNPPVFIIPKDTIGPHLEILEIKDTVINKVFIKKIIFSGYEGGVFETVPIKVIKNNDTLKTPVFKILVLNIPVDEKKQPMFDIKDIKQVKESIFQQIISLWLFFIISLTIFFLILLLYLLLRKKKKKKKINSEIQNISPYQKAINELKDLNNKKYLEEGKSKKYYSEMIDILRNYIEIRYNIPAKTLLTNDLLMIINSKNILYSKDEEKLRTIFNASDLAKFAKSRPSIEDSKNHLKQAIEFIEDNKGISFIDKPIDHL